jgi:hypothetical protein
MNERAKELAIEAVAGALVPMHRWETDPEMLEYVTELIVRECITQINEAIPDTDCSASGAYKTAKIAAIARVKDHFGVES